MTRQGRLPLALMQWLVILGMASAEHHTDRRRLCYQCPVTNHNFGIRCCTRHIDLAPLRGGSDNPGFSSSIHTSNHETNNSHQQDPLLISERMITNANDGVTTKDCPITSSLSSSAEARKPTLTTNPRRNLWKTCCLAVLAWITMGTLFYAHMNHWPYSTAFFYAVDAGMSIGFCTEIAEKTIRSRAFSIIYIILGASAVGGALALFVTDLLEGISTPMTSTYRTLLERDAFCQHDLEGKGYLTPDEFRTLLTDAGYLDNTQKQNANSDSGNQHSSSYPEFHLLDTNKDGRISWDEFRGCFQELQQSRIGSRTNAGLEYWRSLMMTSGRRRSWFSASSATTTYCVFAFWLVTGVSWGMINQGWDVITSTHFAVSALATGGLTAPPVNPDTGFLNPDAAIFCGVYCLLGIPLFYVAMGHFAKTLVHRRLQDVEQTIIETPLQPYEYNMARHLCSLEDNVMHLGDFIVLHFLRRGTADIETLQLLRAEFQRLDRDRNGMLSLEEAMQTSNYSTPESQQINSSNGGSD